jgi:O-antigen ligase
MSSGVVIAFGLLQAFVLPRDFLANFGYGPNTIQPFLTVDPVLHSFRILSTLGGPNQLGSFLILPICLVVAMLVSKPKWWHPPFLLGALVVEWFTYSRSALLGLIVAVGITLILGLPKKIQILVAAFLVLASILGVIAIKSNLNATNNLQYYVLHGSVKNTGVKDSTDLHLDALHSALTEAGKTPLGRGLGAAGPASFHSNKPDITENYYLQLAIETGLVGLVLFVGIITATGLELIPRMRANISAAPVLAALVGISVVNLFLHGWADSSTALTFWAYAGAIIGART